MSKLSDPCEDKKKLRYPFNFIDRVLYRDKSINRVLKNVTCNEWCLACSGQEGSHFPWWALVECMAQSAGTFDEYLQKYSMKTLLIRMKAIEWKKVIIPGEQLIIEAKLVKWFEMQAAYHVQVAVNQENVASGYFYFGREAYNDYERL